jgi:hypothetical protein
MYPHQYSNLDNALLKNIRSGRGRFLQLCEKKSGVLALAEHYRTPDVWRGKTPVREVIKQRLQAMKEIGLIAYDGTQWRPL